MFEYLAPEEIQKLLYGGVKSLALLACYDPEPCICPNFVAMIRSLAPHFDRMLLLTNERDICNWRELPLNCMIRIVPNAALDFGMYSRVCRMIPLDCGLQRLALINDSTMMLRDLGPMFTMAKKSRARFWGGTSSHEVATHLQSYFLVADDAVAVHWLLYFFHVKDISSYVDGDNKDRIIVDYEVGLSQHMLRNRVPLTPMFSMKSIEGVGTVLNPQAIRNGANPSYMHWDALLAVGFPLLKKSRRGVPPPHVGASLIEFKKERAFIVAHTSPQLLPTISKYLS